MKRTDWVLGNQVIISHYVIILMLTYNMRLIKIIIFFQNRILIFSHWDLFQTIQGADL